MSSPEAASSSEDEFDFSAKPSEAAPAAGPLKSEADHSKLFSDEEDESDGAGDEAAAAASKGSDDGRKEKEMEDLFGSDYDSEEEEFKASYVRGGNGSVGENGGVRT